MIIACPACATRYVVPDSAVGVDGRTVRCAKCRHSWFQEGPVLERPVAGAEAGAGAAATPAAEEAAQAEVQPDPGAAAASPSADYPPAADEAAAPPPVIDAAPPPPVTDAYEEPEGSQFDYEPPFRGRRNPLKLWTAAAAIFALLAFGTIAAVSYWGLPAWVPVSRPTFAANQPDLVLNFPPAQQDRRTLPNGTEFFGASGTVTNVGRVSHKVPSILIVLRDERNRIVYSWEVAPPKPTLAPGEVATINEAVTDVPRSAKFAEIGWKPD